MRIEFDLEDGEATWLKSHARKNGLTISAFLRDICLDVHREAEQADGVTTGKRVTRKEQMLQYVRENMSLVRGAIQLRIKMDEVRQWMRDPKFREDLRDAQVYWVDGIQQEMADIGAGKKKGDTNALGWLLNAHHAAFGRAKVELIVKMLDPLIKKLTDFIREELGADAEDGLERAMKRFDAERRKRLTDLT